MTMYSTTFSANQFGGSARRLGHILLAAQGMEPAHSQSASGGIWRWCMAKISSQRGSARL
jgi:hypothetical protein